MYEVLLITGALGFVVMTLMGFVHGGGGHHGPAGQGHAGAHGGHSGHGHAGHGSHSNSNGDHLVAKVTHAPKSGGSPWLMLVSPIDWFALALGAGAAGMLLGPVLAPGLVPWAAVVGALIFNFLVVKPMFAIAMRFVSTPSEGLEGTVDMEARAVTKFDRAGKGLVQLTMDGQMVQLLASLDNAELELGEAVNRGDQLRIVQVDARKNSCTVSKLLRNP